jgi:hypothetical protein
MGRERTWAVSGARSDACSAASSAETHSGMEKTSRSSMRNSICKTLSAT